MDDDLKILEDELRKFSPSPVSGDVLGRMVEAMEKWEDEVVQDDKVVAFPGRDQGPVAKSSPDSSPKWKPMWGAAAAVAILGGIAGFVIPGQTEDSVVALSDLGEVPIAKQAAFAPAGTTNDVRSVSTVLVSDEQGVPYQVIRVDSQQEANFKGTGEVGLKISKPKVDYYVVPVAY
ncbi:MAG: hypothetical protein Q7Q71_12690 [Verrucomicrobiota bacterium JB023]|nr:hypothetical protein [Verrucomicrobiota bacterium JB023]